MRNGHGDVCVLRVRGQEGKIKLIYSSVQSSHLLMIDPDTRSQLSHLIALFGVCDKLKFLKSSFVTELVFARNVPLVAMKMKRNNYNCTD